MVQINNPAENHILPMEQKDSENPAFAGGSKNENKTHRTLFSHEFT